MLVLTRVFVGVGEAAYGPAAPTIISDLYPIEKRGRMLSFFYLAIPVGSAIGYAFGGFVGKAMGWRWPFYLVTIPGLILAALCLTMRDPRGVAKSGEKKPGLKLADVRSLFRIPSYVFNCAGMTAMTFASGGMSFWLPRYLFKDRAADFGVGSTRSSCSTGSAMNTWPRSSRSRSDGSRRCSRTARSCSS